MSRNRKLEVTDDKGRRLFRPREVSEAAVTPDPEDLRFIDALVDYLKTGYRAAETGGKKGKAIAFVMTVFQKIAASSRAAIRRALQRRRDLLLQKVAASRAKAPADAPAGQQEDSRFEGEHQEERVAASAPNPFFPAEIEQLETLLAMLPPGDDDAKTRELLEQIEVLDAREDTRGEKILIFTEYRATQDQLTKHLKSLYGPQNVALIYGGMTLDEKRANVRRFDCQARFLISTEAGGEGINLHKRCHIVINFELPWNPMRLAQRIGRLDRYGQKHPVIVLNLRNDGTIEDRIQLYLDQKIETIMSAFSDLSGDRSEDLRETVLGQVGEELDLDQLYVRSILHGAMSLSQQAIDRAMARVREAAERMNSLFSALESFDIRNYEEIRSQVGLQDIRIFVEHFLHGTGRQLVPTEGKDGVFHFTMPDALDPWELPRRLEDICFSREVARQEAGIRLLTCGHAVLEAMLQCALSANRGLAWTTRCAANEEPGLDVYFQVQHSVGIPTGHGSGNYPYKLLCAHVSPSGDVELTPPRIGGFRVPPNVPPSWVSSRYLEVAVKDARQACDGWLAKLPASSHIWNLVLVSLCLRWR